MGEESTAASAAATLRPPRIVHVLGGFSVGGTERLCLAIVRQWSQKFESVVVGLDPAKHGIESEFLATQGVTIARGPGGGHAARLSYLVRLLRRQQPAGVVVYAFGVAHLIVAVAKLAARSHAPALVSAGNPPPAGSGRWKWRGIVLASRALGVPIMACSETVQRELGELGVGLPSGSGVIYNGCDVSGIAERARSSRGTRPVGSPFVIGMVARLNAIKDHALLLRAFAEVPVRMPERAVELWFVGDGELRPRLQALAGECGVQGSVRFFGAREDVPELLGQMDLFAFCTTRNEGFGIALVEAMAAGTPIVASDVPACREVLAAGRDGVLVEAPSVAAWSAALGSLIEDPARRAQLALQATEAVRARFSAQACAERWIEALGVGRPADGGAPG
ncbi:MAG TPA: glycosyltransferase [Polyangiaceae bacterium]